MFFKPGEVAVDLVGEGRSLAYAARVLALIGVEVSAETNSSHSSVALHGSGRGQMEKDYACVIDVWDFQVGAAGTGRLASASSGVSWVIGMPGRVPVGLPLDIPEKWCGIAAASIALASLLNPAEAEGCPTHFEVSSADVLHGFALQNFGNHTQIPDGWRRNGRTSPEHGGIFPQGFFECGDGYVAIVARSQPDWMRILHAIGDPAWATTEYLNPFKLAEAPRDAEALLRQTVMGFTRVELLERALKFGATVAPIFTADEADEYGIGTQTANTGLPFDIDFLTVDRSEIVK